MHLYHLGIVTTLSVQIGLVRLFQQFSFHWVNLFRSMLHALHRLCAMSIFGNIVPTHRFFSLRCTCVCVFVCVLACVHICLCVMAFIVFSRHKSSMTLKTKILIQPYCMCFHSFYRILPNTLYSKTSE